MRDTAGGVADAENDAAACGVVADVVEVAEVSEGRGAWGVGRDEVGGRKGKRGRRKAKSEKQIPHPAQTAGIRDDRGG